MFPVQTIVSFKDGVPWLPPLKALLDHPHNTHMHTHSLSLIPCSHYSPFIIHCICQLCLCIYACANHNQPHFDKHIKGRA